MAARRQSVCLFCQVLQSAIGRRRINTTAKRRLETIALRNEEHQFPYSHSTETARRDGVNMRAENDMQGNAARSMQAKDRPLPEGPTAEEMRLAMEDFQALCDQRDLRLQVLRKISNPWPTWNEKNHHNANFEAKKPQLQLPEAGAAIVPHHVFRITVRETLGNGDKAVRLVLRAQLLQCHYPRDVLRILAAAMLQHKVIARNLANLTEPIIRAMYRIRNNVSDPEVLRTLNLITKRFELAGVYHRAPLLYVGLKFAARSRSLNSMKRYLRLIRERQVGMSSHVFRSVIAKCSIGHRGLGEIRNGRWHRGQLMQVLTGFDDCRHLPPEEQYHLGSFLVRDDWQYLHGWVAVLGRCKDSDAVWREWELWKTCPARLKPRGLDGQENAMTTKSRGDYWFVEQMTYTDDLKRAWQLVDETCVEVKRMKGRVKSRLLEGLEFAPEITDELKELLVWKYDRELSRIEDAFSVKWTPLLSDGLAAVAGNGVHELVGDEEEALEKLSTIDVGAEDFGFPYEEGGSRLVDAEEQPLHDAQEKGFVDASTSSP